MKKLVAISLALTFGAAVPVVAQQPGCVMPAISVCPNLYIDRCRTDAAFRGSAPLQCSEALAGKAKDAPECAKFDPNSCVVMDCEDTSLHPLKAFYCRQGYPACPQRIPELQKSFDEALSSLSQTLTPLQELTQLDPASIPDTEQLCSFSTDRIEVLQQQAQAAQDAIEQDASNLLLFRECNRLTVEFLDSPPPENISNTLWENIRTVLSDQIRGVSRRQGEVDSSIEALKQAPQKIRDLRLVHDFACAAEMEQKVD